MWYLKGDDEALPLTAPKTKRQSDNATGKTKYGAARVGTRGVQIRTPFIQCPPNDRAVGWIFSTAYIRVVWAILSSRPNLFGRRCPM